MAGRPRQAEPMADPERPRWQAGAGRHPIGIPPRTAPTCTQLHPERRWQVAGSPGNGGRNETNRMAGAERQNGSTSRTVQAGSAGETAGRQRRRQVTHPSRQQVSGRTQKHPMKKRQNGRESRQAEQRNSRTPAAGRNRPRKPRNRTAGRWQADPEPICRQQAGAERQNYIVAYLRPNGRQNAGIQAGRNGMAGRNLRGAETRAGRTQKPRNPGRQKPCSSRTQKLQAAAGRTSRQAQAASSHPESRKSGIHMVRPRTRPRNPGRCRILPPE